MTVEVDYTGRFGNNLFQYIFGRLWAKRNNLQLTTPFNHPTFVTMSPAPKGEVGTGPRVKIDERTGDLTKRWPPAKYWIHGYFQRAEFYWPNKKEILDFATPATKVEKRPIGDLVVNFRIDLDYRQVGIHPSWYRRILKSEPYDRLYVVSDVEDAEYFREALAGHSYEILRGDPKQQWDYLRGFRRMISSNSTFTWWAVFFGYSERTIVVKDWIGNGAVHLTDFPGAVPVEGTRISTAPWTWRSADEDVYIGSSPKSPAGAESPMKRNLVYYIYPKHAEGWRWHVKRIQDFWPVFSGHKRVLISVDDKTESPDLVKSAFTDPSVEFEVIPNDPLLWETKHFIDAIARLESTNPGEATFYAHAKGVIHSDDQIRRVWRWCDAMYTLNLASPAFVDKILSTYEALGCFKFPPREWFYAGTFFWFKHSALFSKKWREIGTDRFAVERWLARHINSQQAYTTTPFLGGGELYGNPPRRRMVLGWLREHMTRFGIPGFEDIKAANATQ